MMKLVSPRLCHSVSPSRVGILMRFGFTQRQARFLGHVLIFSGVFLERQYRTFTGLSHGQKTQDFLAKLVNAGYATPTFGCFSCGTRTCSSRSTNGPFGSSCRAGSARPRRSIGTPFGTPSCCR